MDKARKYTEQWLIARPWFVDCHKCAVRHEGCQKDCRFYQTYRKNIKRGNKNAKQR